MFIVGKYYRLKGSFVINREHEYFCRVNMKGEPRRPRKLLKVANSASYDYFKLTFEGISVTGGWSSPSSKDCCWEECNVVIYEQGEMEL